MGSQATNGTARFAGFALELRTGELVKNGRRVRLQAQPLKALRILLEHSGELVSREQLRKEVWPEDTFVDFDHGLNKAIAKLRDAVDDLGADMSIIETLPRLGYRFVPPVEWGAAEHDASFVAPGRRTSEPEAFYNAEAAVEHRVSVPSVRLERWVLWGAVAVGLVAAVIGLSFSVAIRRSSSQEMRLVPLTTLKGAELDPSFSRSGDQIAFVWDENTGRKSDVFIKRVGVDAHLRVTAGKGFACCPVWTSEDRYIVYSRCNPDKRDLLMVSSVGGPERRIGDSSCDGASASRDGNVVVYANRAIYWMNLQDLQQHQLTFPSPYGGPDIDPAISPDGRRVAFVRIAGEAVADIYEVPLKGGEPRQITFDSKYIGGVTWTADGKDIIFSSHRAGSTSLWRIPATGGTPQRLPMDSSFAEHPALSPNGRRLAYMHGQFHPNIWAMNLGDHETKESPLIVSNTSEGGPDLSADGSKVVFASSRSGDSEIWICAFQNCASPIQLTSLGVLSGTPRFSPDGKQVAFDSRPGKHSQVFVINSQGGEPVQLTSGDFENKIPSWSTDGKSIYFLSNRSGRFEIWKVPSAGGTAVQITRNGGFAAFESPDGQSLYYTKADVRGIWRMPSHGGAEKLVIEHVEPEFWGYWSIADKGVFYVESTDSEQSLGYYDFKTQQSRKVMDLNKPLQLGSPGMSVSRDGRLMLLSEVESDMDIMMVENFR